jgi:hypothetical protein
VEVEQEGSRVVVIDLGGALKSRSIKDQMNQTTCLRLPTAAIIACNASSVATEFAREKPYTE